MTESVVMQSQPELETNYFDLGSFHRPITTTNEEAQVWFDRGLVWCYGFNRTEAAACFRRAIAADSECAIAYWGLAYALGPYYNQSWKLFGEDELKSTLVQTYKTVQEAKSRLHRASPVEQALIRAIQCRHPSTTPPDDFSEWDQNYVRAMEKAYKAFGHDLDVAALYADALMVLTPWALWDPWSGEPAPKARTFDAKAVLEAGLAHPKGYEHPGLLHFYIHLMEMSRQPESVLLAADRLRHLVPDAGHLNHMPSHIDVLVGDYRRAIEANAAAVRADNLYVERAGGLNAFAIYRAHDYHSLIYAAMLAGKSVEALEYSAEMEKALPEHLLRIQTPNMADWAEAFHAVRPHVLIRFGRWQDIINLRVPTDQDLYCVTTANLHYAKGVAWAALGNIRKAESEQQLFHKASRKVPPTRYDFPNRCIDILPVAEAMLAGEIEYRKGNVEKAFEHLRRSIDLDDHLGYSEPWPWMQPTRHAYGALLMEQGRYKEAVPIYESDLGLNQSLPRGHQNPNNVWSLVAYHECLVRLGRDAEARLLELPLRAAKQLADIEISSSCFCKRAGSEQAKCCSANKGQRLTGMNKL